MRHARLSSQCSQRSQRSSAICHPSCAPCSTGRFKLSDKREASTDLVCCVVASLDVLVAAHEAMGKTPSLAASVPPAGALRVQLAQSAHLDT